MEQAGSVVNASQYPELVDIHVQGFCGEESTVHVVMTEYDVCQIINLVEMSRNSVCAYKYQVDINRLREAFLHIQAAVREAVLHNFLME